MPPGMLAYRFFAREYGWTPAQVLDLDADHIDWFMIAEEAAAGAERIRSKPKPVPKFSPGPGGFGGGQGG